MLNSFQQTVTQYRISATHVEAFLTSMKYDLNKKQYISKTETDAYIYGSADVVGLMCLRVFCNGDDALYLRLEQSAMRLGSAFQKVNFLRDLRDDLDTLGRSYFPGVDKHSFDDDAKLRIVAEIEEDFDCALSGIRQLPTGSKLPVLIAYLYYRALLSKIKHTPARHIIHNRIRVSNPRKQFLIAKALFINQLNIV